jgi:hypothetical protein
VSCFFFLSNRNDRNRLFRFFIVHEDGSGTELLRFKDLYAYLRTMDLDPSTAVVREPLLSNPKVTGATVMRPFQGKKKTFL